MIVTPLDDTVAESNETVGITLSDYNYQGGMYTPYSIGSPSATVTILDNEPRVWVDAPDASARETLPAQVANTGAFRVTRSGGSSTAPLTVTYTVSGTATNGVDYVSVPRSVTIPAGATSATLTITPRDDTFIEGPETVILMLTAQTTYHVSSPSSATVTIVDNE